MIVGMRTRTQAARVAELTAGNHLAGKPKPDGSVPLSRFVDVGVDFEVHGGAVESVSVLFELYAGAGHGYAASGALGDSVSTGWMVTGAQFEVGWPTDPQRARLVRSHSGLTAKRSIGASPREIR